MSRRRLLGDVLEVGGVQRRQDESVDAVRRAASAFSRMPPTGRTRPRERDLSRHRDVFASGLLRTADKMAVAIVTPADGPSLESRRRHVDVQVVMLEEVLRDAELGGVRADMADRCARGLLHHVAKLAGQDHVLAAARQQRGFDEEDVAAGLRPCDAGGHAGTGGAEDGVALEAGRPR